MLQEISYNKSLNFKTYSVNEQKLCAKELASNGFLQNHGKNLDGSYIYSITNAGEKK